MEVNIRTVGPHYMGSKVFYLCMSQIKDSKKLNQSQNENDSAHE